MSARRWRGGMAGGKSPYRRPRIVQARWHAMTILRDEFRWSYPKIGAAFGKDHSTVMYGVKKHRSMTVGIS